jgi:ATP-dependent DNA helicase RecQ
VTDKFSALKQYFGYDTFRIGQERLVDGILAGRDAFGVMPTGAGKSLCFQLPALILDGITLVISPLISLMKDQVNSLTQAGIPAAYLNSSLTAGQYRLALERARQSVYKIIYVAPERLLTDEFLSFAESADISMVTVDEAHCVSQWGQDFRPSYLKIHEFIGMLPKRPAVSAFTATATEQVREDVVRLLELNEPVVETTGFDRSNLCFRVEKPRDKFTALLHLWRENEGKSGVVYCSTRKTVEEVCERLCGEGCPATRYHAGLTDAERRNNQDDFIYDRAPVMVATNAFGMGIDKSNVGLVVHYNMPKDMESYYQEAGRAGRDGEPALCVLFYSGQDVRTNQYFIEHSRENEELDDAARELVMQRDRERLKAMTFYCFTDNCLRAYILRYFGERSAEYCGNCGNCVRDTQETDITQDAQKILSCVKRAGERFGAKLIVAVLRGNHAEKERIQRYGLEGLPTYGIMANVGEVVIYDEIRFLQREGYLCASDDEYKVLALGEKSGEVLFQGKNLRMKLPKEKESGTVKKSGAQQKLANPKLFERLKKLRAKLADARGVPAYVIFSDATLRDMCARLPQTRAELMEVSGVGVEKSERYGESFLAAIAEPEVESPDGEGQAKIGRAQFCLSEERKKQVELFDEPVSVKVLADRINTQIDTSRMRRLSATKITDWLLQNGVLEETMYLGRKARVASERSVELGIYSEERENEDGEKFMINLYDTQAQRYILDSLDEIMGK